MIPNYKWCQCCRRTKHLDAYDRGSNYCESCHLVRQADIIELERQQLPRYKALLAECRRKARFPWDDNGGAS